MDWKQYEREIADYFRSEYPDARITANTTLPGRFSKIEREIDLLIEDEAVDFAFRIRSRFPALINSSSESVRINLRYSSSLNSRNPIGLDIATLTVGVAEERKEILTHAVSMPTTGLLPNSGELAVATHQHVLTASEYRPLLKRNQRR